MMFADEHLELIRAGEKTETRRDWSDEYHPPREGSIQMATPASEGPFVSHEECSCYIRVREVYQERLDAMTDLNFEREGGYSREEFIDLWRDLHGEWNPSQQVTVVRFEYVGDERPTDEGTDRNAGD
jgi:hypothetical protein